MPHAAGAQAGSIRFVRIPRIPDFPGWEVAVVSTLPSLTPSKCRNTGRLSIGNYHRGLGCNNFPQLAAARARNSRSRVAACCSNAARSTAPTNPWVGETQAVGHRVIPFDRMNLAIASRSSSDILSPSAADSPLIMAAFSRLRRAQTGPCVTNVVETSIVKMVNFMSRRSVSPRSRDKAERTIPSHNRSHENEAESGRTGGAGGDDHEISTRDGHGTTLGW